jgi:hypothetical protein
MLNIRGQNIALQRSNQAGYDQDFGGLGLRLSRKLESKSVSL